MSGQPVRVCFLIDRLSRAGTETQLLALIRHLDRSNVFPVLALLDGTDDESRSLEPERCEVLRLGLTSLRPPVAVARAAARLVRFWNQHEVSVVQTYFLDSTYFGVPLARAAGIRTVIRVRNNLGHWLTRRHRALGRVVGRLAHMTLTNSEAGRVALMRAERGPAHKLAVLENGVDLDEFAAVPPPRRGAIITIGAVANLRPVKGIDLLVRAAAEVIRRCPQARFVVAGEGEQRPELEQLIVQLGLGEHFQLLGTVNDMPDWLESVDVAVLPSRAEGMSNALLEFMAAGRPVVATDVGANRQLLSGGTHGLVVPPEDVPALGAALVQLIVNSNLATKLADAARLHAAERYSRAAMRERFETFYRRLSA